MINALFTIFGAFLAVIGGFLNQLYQNSFSQKREDREPLHQAEEILIEIQPILDDLPAAREQLNAPGKRLLSIANRIWTRSNLELAEKLIEFARKDADKTKENAIKLLKEIAAKNGKALDKFHRRQNELFKKASEELRQIREK